MGALLAGYGVVEATADTMPCAVSCGWPWESRVADELEGKALKSRHLSCSGLADGQGWTGRWLVFPGGRAGPLQMSRTTEKTAGSSPRPTTPQPGTDDLVDKAG